MEFRPIQKSDKAIYEAFYKDGTRMASDASFLTPYAWAGSYAPSLYTEKDLICVEGKPKGRAPYYLMPQGPGDKIRLIQQMHRRCLSLSLPFSIHWVLKDELPLVKEAIGDAIWIEDVRDGADYIYETASLCTLSGKKLHAKRNHVNTFKATYSHRFETITAENLDKASAFVYARCNTQEEKIAMQRLFQAYFDFALTGMLLYANETLCAVTVGEKINADTALIHLEKGDTSFTGAYAAVNQIFISNYFPDTVYVNREEDMGIEGLRKAKLSYRPAFLLEKYNVYEAK